MSEHKITIEWKRDTETFDYNEYTRDHRVVYGSGSTICASAAPEYMGNPQCFNPEQAFVTSLASCHMLTFLALASKKGYIIDFYNDNAVGILGRNADKMPAITRVELFPKIILSGDKVLSTEELHSLHEKAHHFCFIANSIASCVEVVVNPEIVEN